MTTVRFEPAGPPAGRLRVPPDKSISHRAALLAMASPRTVSIGSYLESEDTLATLSCVEALGATVVRRASEAPGAIDVEISGVGAGRLRAGTDQVPLALDCANAGTLIRLLCGWLAGRGEGRWTLDGDDSLRARPMERIAEPLRLMGATVTTDAGRPPIRVEGSRLRGIEYEMPLASAQVKSCLMLAALGAEGRTVIVEPAPSRDHSERMLEAAGIEISRTGSRVELGPGSPELPDLEVPGDPSSAAFHLVAAAVSGGEVTVEGVCLNPGRMGILGVLERMGADVEVQPAGVAAGEPLGSVTVCAGELEATTVSGAEVPTTIDELPLVALLGALASGETVVGDAAELRHKESDRIATIVAALTAVGAEIEARADGFAVAGTGRRPLPGGTVDAAGDHRIAMLGAVAALACEGPVEVEGFEAAAVSYPNFEADLSSLTG